MDNLKNKPTKEEINSVINYFKTEDEEEGYNLYIRKLVEKHGQKWVEEVLSYVIVKIASEKR